MDLSRSVYSRDLKITAMRALDAGAKAGELARKYQLSPKLLERWRGEWRARGEAAFPGTGRRGSDLPAVDDAQRIAELERKIGQMTMENDFLKKALQHFKDHHLQPSSMARMSACRNRSSSRGRQSGERFVPDDRLEPSRVLPLAHAVSGHATSHGIAS
jgi:transposase-like protein